MEVSSKNELTIEINIPTIHKLVDVERSKH